MTNDRIVVSNIENDFSKKISYYFNANWIIHTADKFKCGEYVIDRQKDMACSDVIALFLFKPDHNLQDQLFQLLMMIESLDDYDVTLFCPYLPYLRADDKTIAFLKSIFASWPVQKFVTFEPHGDKNYISAKEYYTIPMAPWVVSSFKEKLHYKNNDDHCWVIVAPDRGACVRAKEVARALNLLCLELDKTRIDGDIRFKLKGELHSDKAISFCLIDDIVDSGKTLEGASAFLREHFPNTKDIIAYSAHCIGACNIEGLSCVHFANYMDHSQQHVADPIDATDYFCDFLKSLE